MAKYRYAATRQFEKDVKLCIKQGKSMALLQKSLPCYLNVANCLPNTIRINYPVALRASGNATSNRIGCCSGNNMMTNKSC